MKTCRYIQLPLYFIWALCSYALAGERDTEEADEGHESDSPFSFETEIDVEASWETLGIKGAEDETESSPLEATLNLKPEYALNDSSRIILDYELDNEEGGHAYVKELFLETKWPEWGLKLGRQTLPISDSEGEFINDNFYEFAETRETALLASYSFDSGFGLSGYVFNSDVDTSMDGHELDAGTAASFTSKNGLIFAGIGYMTDLSEVLEPLVEISNTTYLPRTPVLSGQLYITTESWRIMLEHIEATDDLAGAEPGFRHPRTTSLESFIKKDKRWLLGGRYQTSSEMEGLPKHQYGVTTRFWMDETLSMGVEYLYGQFHRGLFDEEGKEIHDTNIVTIELTMEF